MDLQYNGATNPVDGTEFLISGDAILSHNTQMEQSDQLRLNAYYYGIKDYSLLFPHVNASDASRAKRMGKFYEEAEGAFDAGAWLSFMLMCAAIFEHILYFKLACLAGIDTLSKANNTSLRRNLIDAAQFAIIDSTRNARNAIDCNNLAAAYITRSEAMNVRSLIEKLMLQR